MITFHESCLLRAIKTRYCGPTNTKGARIIATSGDCRAVVSCPHELSGEHAHKPAVEALCHKLGWNGRLVCGATPTGYVWTFVEFAASEVKPEFWG